MHTVHISTDKILLDGTNFGSDDDSEDEEVFALTGLEEEELEEEDISANEGAEEEPLEETRPRKKATKKSKKIQESESASSSEEEETWGKTKSAYYSSNAAQLESDDDEGNELEEQEARRLQGKIREDMKEEDFGLGDIPNLEGQEEMDPLMEPASAAMTPFPQDPKLLVRHLEKTSPETLALARDWQDTVQDLEESALYIKAKESKDTDALTLGMLHLHYQTLLTYTTTLAFYLHLRASEKYAQQPELLRAHPVYERLLTLKQGLTTLEELDLTASDDEDDEDDSDDFGTGMLWDEIMDNDIRSLDEGLDEDELEDLLKDAFTKQSQAPHEPPKKKRKIVSRSEDPPVFDLIEPEFTFSKPLASHVQPSAGSDAYGETTALQHADAADKTARNKTLRFHTSRIESASARRQNARNQAVGGDDDLPYRERRREKEARLAKEAAARVRGQGEDLDDTEPEYRQQKRQRDGDGSSEQEETRSPDGYYELIKRKSKEKKEQKKADYKIMQVAARPDLNENNTNGPRSLTRAILANKGLTPHRPKSVRNPRVKKRQKFEKAKKKIASQKAVYKGGLAESGRYDGEKSGISKVIKSVRLG
ncbi:Sas10 C-terminal domain-containing protein [Collybia nuda]|uniref:Sas10 C-terminal domain-containing protein n=1 Tax=Collybia nuda TaxID=64659 RepID=A0A9P5YIP0_9AGAR|nr:Sas10 C-terminal domain-containing protein [Collybia nuda]